MGKLVLPVSCSRGQRPQTDSEGDTQGDVTWKSPSHGRISSLRYYALKGETNPRFEALGLVCTLHALSLSPSLI